MRRETGTSFQSIMEPVADSPLPGPEPLAGLPYERELAIKQDAFAEFWKTNRLPGKPEPVVGAAQPRGYRTTSKRRIRWTAPGKIAVAHNRKQPPGLCPPSLLEPAMHAALYRHCHTFLCKKGDQSLARALNWIAVRGNSMVVLVVDRMDAAIVRQAKRLAEDLPALGFPSSMLYADPSRSDYYLEAERPTEGVSVKHLSGPRLLTLSFDDEGSPVSLKYPPTVFSQINEAMIPQLVSTARRLLLPRSRDRLLDLYCGYGLFAFTLGQGCRETVGVELAGTAIETARETARRRNQEKKFRFTAARIEKDTLEKRLPGVSEDEIVLLDPPRQGPEPGVIEAIAARGPRRVLHIACGTDELIPAIKTWTGNGYQPDRAVPLDLFPGTVNLETLVSFVPAR